MGWVLFFDGECAFCSASVRRVARIDKRGQVEFAPLQGKLASEMGLAGYAADSGGTLVLLREADGSVFTRSDALLELARVLGGFWKLATVVRCIPRVLRDAAYRWIADHRYLLMGKSASCALPDPELRKRLRE
jgi:predicted DCC family thiol-disulfide oxidoreductase YuxK